MKKIIIILILFTAGIVFRAEAQYGFGTNTPNSQAVIDANDAGGNKGMLIPRVALTASNNILPFTGTLETSMMVYNTATTVLTGTNAQYNVSPGYYYWNGTKWIRFGTSWFFMPSIKLDLTPPYNEDKTPVNLYDKFTSQFANPIFKSVGAPEAIPYIPAATDIYYYITNCDTDVFSIVSLTNAGVLTYQVKKAPTEATYMNIVFVIK